MDQGKCVFSPVCELLLDMSTGQAGPSTHREVEVKMRVTGDFDVTAYLHDLPGITLVGPSTAHMRATYYDTAELTLLRWGITVRRREGGTDSGWHMKLPVADNQDGAREELHLPLTAVAGGVVPDEFISIIAPLLRKKHIEYLADINTTRVKYTLVDKHGESLVEVADDLVNVEQNTSAINSFHEIEVEILHESKRAMKLLREVQKRILDSGATPMNVSKLASAMGPVASEPPDVPDLDPPLQNCLAVEFIRYVIAEHTRHFLLADVSVRRGEPDSIHQMRVSARRLRSTLGSFKGLVDAERAQHLRDELAWIARELGEVRDLEVLLGRLTRQASELSDPTDADVAVGVVGSELQQRLDIAQGSALAALRSPRHHDLVEDLIAASSQPPVTEAACKPARQLLTSMAQRTWVKLAKDVRGLSFTSHDTQWHAARIRAKRARYTADAAAMISGKAMRTYAQELATITDILGDLHDAHVAELFLRELSQIPHVSGAQGLALGRLLDLQIQHNHIERRRFTKAWPATRLAAQRAGMRRSG
jgi:CHAD domain-containing protein